MKSDSSDFAQDLTTTVYVHGITGENSSGRPLVAMVFTSVVMAVAVVVALLI